MKIIRTAALVAAAAAAVSKAKEYARENPAQASETLDSMEGFLRDKAGPKYADKIGTGTNAIRSSLGLTGQRSRGTSAGPAAQPVRSSTSGDAPESSPSEAGTSPPGGFDPSI